MRRETVTTLATQLSRTPQALLEQLQAAGLPHSSIEDAVTEEDKTALLNYLKRCHGADDASRKKIVLTKCLANERVTITRAEAKAVQRIARAKGHTLPLSTDSTLRSYLEQVLAILEGYPPEGDATEQLVDEVFEHYLYNLADKGEHVRRCEAIATLASTSHAADKYSCSRAQLEARIHPAFAPPSVVI